MTTSVFELFKIGVGPSSSHTMGPMTAACDFIERLRQESLIGRAARISTDLYGSLALTGKGHATDRAVLLGLSGCRPDNVCPDAADQMIDEIRTAGRLMLAGRWAVNYDESRDLRYHQRERLPYHSNGMRFSAEDQNGSALCSKIFYSVGGGAVVDEATIVANAPPGTLDDVPYPFNSSAELLARAQEAGLALDELALANEMALRSKAAVSARLEAIVAAMSACIDRGISRQGTLPGGLNVERRAFDIHAKLLARQEATAIDPLWVFDWVSVWALSVNEENAAGGRVVTAPTNGAAGIIPAVLRYYKWFVPGASEEGAHRFLLVAGLVGSLFRENASISGAEVGCQGEVGVACSMAAAGLTSVLGGTNAQIENAAEIGMEHNLGLTCDPVGGLVQVPCIERNAMGAIKAIEAARLALLGNGIHRVSLDQVIETMRRTGADMSERYKETSLGGLAVNVVAC